MIKSNQIKTLINSLKRDELKFLTTDFSSIVVAIQKILRWDKPLLDYLGSIRDNLATFVNTKIFVHSPLKLIILTLTTDLWVTLLEDPEVRVVPMNTLGSIQEV